MAAILIALMLVAAASSASVDQCPDNLRRDEHLKVFGDQCFRFHLFERREFDDARKICARDGGTLAMPKTHGTDYFIASELHYTYQYRHDVWIGLSDKEDESVLKWDDGSILHSEDYADWGQGQGPENIFFRGLSNCVVINPLDRYSWYDTTCSGPFTAPSYAFVCQFDANTIPKTSDAPTPQITSSLSTTKKSPTSEPSTPRVTTKEPTTRKSTTLKSTTPKPTTPKPTTPKPTTCTPKTTTLESTTPKSTTPVSSNPTTQVCPPFNCDKDCGMEGYAIDKATGCVLCKCSV